MVRVGWEFGDFVHVVMRPSTPRVIKWDHASDQKVIDVKLMSLYSYRNIHHQKDTVISLRLPADLEGQLEYYSLASGRPKNTIVSEALALLMKTVDLSQMPLSTPIQESPYHRHLRVSEEQRKQYLHAHEIADWIRTNVIWTKKVTAKTSSGEPTPGSYGRNVVVGFTDSFKPDGEEPDNKLYVISRNLASVGRGTDSHHLYLTAWEDWVEYMTPVSGAN